VVRSCASTCSTLPLGVSSQMTWVHFMGRFSTWFAEHYTRPAACLACQIYFRTSLRSDNLQQLHRRLMITVNDRQSAIGRERFGEAEPPLQGCVGNDAKKCRRLNAPQHVVLNENPPQWCVFPQNGCTHRVAAQAQVDAHDAELHDAIGPLQCQQDL